MKKYIVVLLALLVTACASTEITDLERLEHEADRQEKYIQWHKSCMDLHLTVLTLRHNMRPRCPRKGLCIPSRWGWDFYYLPPRADRPLYKVDWRTSPANTVMCGRWVF